MNKLGMNTTQEFDISTLLIACQNNQVKFKIDLKNKIIDFTTTGENYSDDNVRVLLNKRITHI